MKADFAEPLPHAFYERSTLIVAEQMLGKHLYRRKGRKMWIGKIVEVEAYIGEDDPACHAYRGLTPRTRIMYGPPGHAYVYFTYGMYWMLNVVTEKEGFPAAVLIRALEPIAGFGLNDLRPASGPGKLCRSMEIDKQLNGVPLASNQLWIAESNDPHPKTVRWSPRIGISVGTQQPWRAFIADNPFISGKRSHNSATPLFKR